MGGIEVCVIISFLLLILLIGRYCEKKEWNNGYCGITRKKWNHFDINS